MTMLMMLGLLITFATGVLGEEAIIQRPLIDVTGVVVDTDGKPVAGAQVQDASGLAPIVVADANGCFEFSTAIFGGHTASLTLVGCDDSGKLLGHEYIGAPGLVPEKKTCRLVLKPATIMQVKVLGSRDIPVTDAHVWVEHQAYLSRGRTNASGVAQLRIPAEVPVWHVFTSKAGEGFNYHENFSPGNKYKNADPTPRELTLRLQGARRLQIKAEDSRGKPMAGVSFCPWYIKTFGKQDELNVSAGDALRELCRTTDAQGVATFDWLPMDGTGTMPILEAGMLWHHQPQQVNFDFADNSKFDTPLLTTRVLHRVPLRGKVVMPDGVMQAPGILVMAEGRGATNHYFREYTRTDASGSFAFMAYPQQHYIISVQDKDWAAQSITGFYLPEDAKPGELRLQLVKGTLLEIKITKGVARTPMETNVVLTQVGSDIPDQPGRKESEPYSEREELVRWPAMSRPGHYFIRVGPGLHELTVEGALDSEPQMLEVKDEPVIRKAYHFDQ